MTDFWFKPKTHGYGAQPSNWKGWAAIGVFLFAVCVLTWQLMVAPNSTGGAPTTMQVLAWLGLLLMLITGFIIFCRAKTDGPWKWRWGGK